MAAHATDDPWPGAAANARVDGARSQTVPAPDRGSVPGMRSNRPVYLEPWMLPLVALAIAIPIAAAMIVAGPQAGLAVGALVALVIVLVAIRLRPVEEFEIATATDARRRVLVLATATVEDPAVAAEIADAAGAPADDAEVLVVAPALNSRLAHWTSDLRRARLEAQQRLAISLATLAAAAVPATGRVGDTDPIQAAEDELRGFAADEVVLVSGRGGRRDLREQLARRLDVPLRHLVAAGEPAPGEPERGD